MQDIKYNPTDPIGGAIQSSLEARYTIIKPKFLCAQYDVIK